MRPFALAVVGALLGALVPASLGAAGIPGVGLAAAGDPVVGSSRPAGSPGGSPAVGSAERDTAGEIVAIQRPTTKAFYGWQILATGGVGGLVSAAAILLPEKPLGSVVATAGFILGMPTYTLGGPVVHWAHGDFTKGLVSFGSNFALPIVAGFAGQSIGCSHGDDNDCGSRGFLTGAAVVMLIVPLVDAVALGWEEVPVDDFTSRGSSTRIRPGSASPRWTVLPTWNLGPRGSFELGLTGKF